jgi:phage terminase large subunit-like protein
MMDVQMAIDPAAGESAVADDYGCTVIGRDRYTGRRYVLHSSKYQGSITGAISWAEGIYRHFEPISLGIEASMTVCAFWQMMRDSGKYRAVKLTSKGKSKEERARLVEPHMESGMILFHPSHYDLYDQLLSFPSPDVKDDVADSFFYANELLDGFGSSDVPTAARTDSAFDGIN